MEDFAVVKIVDGSIGLVHPDQAEEFYDSMHSYLSKVGITGVKVDAIHALEYVSEDYGGRVDLAKAYYKGLSKSLEKNFNGTGLIFSMQQCNNFFLLGTQQISMGRVGDDFWIHDPEGDPMGVYWLQGVHMIHCAYNSLWMGHFIQPDWDMFQSAHLCAKFHAGSRAICGGPVYVSDSVGGHDFDLLKKLYGGVLGAFNCQGAGWDPKEQRIKGYSHCYKPISGSIHVSDIEWDQKKEATEMGEAEEYAVYFSEAEKLTVTMCNSDAIPVTIQPSTFEIFCFIPIKKLGRVLKFAPIGLTNMFNSGGTIQGLFYNETSVEIEVKGGGNFLAYSSMSPEKCFLNGAEVGFNWDSD
ncbi:putative galactinol--sucrose galactosyltransferase 4 [Forsythia ovata]|uniref:Galactinol--sucrose galactosyltransferase 4 n=1 Tax=Forsythia ovata TaxID=205694 RepID=A0ABD1VD00_9LAMI